MEAQSQHQCQCQENLHYQTYIRRKKELEPMPLDDIVAVLRDICEELKKMNELTEGK